MEEKRFAVLIDGDNISSKYIKTIIDEITNEGVITYKRIYCDWTSPVAEQWKKVLLENSITPMQQYSYTFGKNSTDSAMIIDAMDILYAGKVDGFCIASSDSDFTKLASRLREAGMTVIGMGEQKTPRPFVTACDRFKFLDVLFSGEKDKIVPHTEAKKAKAKANGTATAVGVKIEEVKPISEQKSEQEIKTDTSKTSLKEIKRAVAKLITDDKGNGSDRDEWMPVSRLGSQLQKLYPDFDTRNYGYSKMTLFIESMKNEFETQRYQDPNNKNRPNSALVYVRIKQPTESGNKKSGKNRF